MKLDDLLQKWLPDYERYERLVHYAYDFEDDENTLNVAAAIAVSYPEAFTEALQAYTDAVCKAQKKECLAVLGRTLLGRFCSSERMFAAVENTPQPKIEAL